MITLSIYTLGTPRIHGSAGALNTPLVRRRALALLAVVAGSGYGGIERDRLTALLWPDSDMERGRNNLRQTLFTLRRMFGYDVFHHDTVALRINPLVAQVDVWDFEAAVAAGQDETAASLYGGVFMADFTVAGLDGLDRWLDAQRSRLQTMARTVFERLTRLARQSGDREGALRWARALVALEPLSSRAALELLVALVAVGDRAGALAYAREHENVLKQQLDTVPDERVSRYIRELRQLPGWDGPDRRTQSREPLPGAIHGATRRSVAPFVGGGDIALPLAPSGELRFASPLQRALFELVYVAPAYLALAETHEAQGDRAEAVRHYEAFLRMCRDADHETQLKRAHAEARLAALTQDAAADTHDRAPRLRAAGD